MSGFTLGTGALSALERKSHRMRTTLRLALDHGLRIVVPSVVLGEWWRGRTTVRDAIVAAVEIEPLGTALAKAAGEALAAVRGATFVDSIVMASDAQRGDVVFTSDEGDLQALWTHFRAVRRILRAS